VHIVVDESITGTSITQTIRNETLSRPVTFNFITRGSPDDIVRECSKISRDDVLVYAVYFDPQVGYVSNDNLLRAIRSQVDMPVYTFWSFNMAAGATGGYLYDGYALGREGARRFRMQIDGSLWSYTPVISRWTFDAAQVRRYSLDVHGLKDVILLKKPLSFWEANRTLLIGSAGVILILLVIMSLIYVNFRIQKRLVASGAEKIGVQKELMALLGDVIEKRSGETGSHVQRVTLLSLRLAELLHLSDEYREHLEICASMHDIGKIAIPDAILLKQGMLDPDEERVMRTHPEVGHLIFRHHESPIFSAATAIAFEHHERWDGNGYPMGKKGDGIHILARIVSIVDVFDALLSERPYKRAWTPDEVKSLIAAESGRSFDPAIAGIFLSHLNEFIAIRDSVTE
jgi:HD-GYP domain-containing protein (c-di-GMP phosphodiesterase class II)